MKNPSCGFTDRFGVGGFVRIAVAVGLLLGAVVSSFAGYAVKSKIHIDGKGCHYTWTVYNHDQNPGLCHFLIEVPTETKVLSHTVPRSYSKGNGDAYWIMTERVKAQSHEQAWLRAPSPGKKWLKWAGMQSASVYPAGSTVVFSVTTDHAVKPGAVVGAAVSYTPQNDPHYYRPVSSEVMGPGAVVADDARSGVQSGDFPTADAHYYSWLSADPDECIANAPSGPEESATHLDVALFAGARIEGAPGGNLRDSMQCRSQRR